LERYTLRSVGIDIGSATSHIILSKLELRRLGSSLSSQFAVSRREVSYASDVFLTPYLTASLIDTDVLGEFFHNAYRAAGVAPGQVDTGVVIITGEALKKENAEQIATMIARWSGQFICVSAGLNHEALLAAHGSGAIELSGRDHSTVLNVDVGGGTTKISLIVDGAVTHTEAFSVGARLIAVDEHSKITRIEEPARVLLGRLGLAREVGEPLDDGERRRLAELMADLLMAAIEGGSPLEELRRELFVTDDVQSAQHRRPVDTLVFSGGLSEYVTGGATRDYGDLGRPLGAAVRERLAARALLDKVAPAVQGIRATVLGASQYSLQASGQTSFVSDPGALPVWGLTCVRPVFSPGADAGAAMSTALRQRDLRAYQPGVAVAPVITGTIDYRALRRYAEAVVATVAAASQDLPLFIVLRPDIAQSFGRILKRELRWPGAVTVVDGIDVGDFDCLDIGRPVSDVAGSLPVTIKSLTFPGVAPDRAPAPVRAPAPAPQR
jgi:ethanolamine utilization protein EutA